MSRSGPSFKAVKILTFVFCLLFSLALLAVLGLQMRDLSGKKENIETSKIHLARVRTEIEELILLKEKYQAEKDDFARFLFAEKDIPTFLEEISGMAKKSKVNINTMRTNNFKVVTKVDPEAESDLKRRQNKNQADLNKPKGPQLYTMPIDISVRGEFKPMLDFLYAMENQRLLVTLTDVTLKVREYPELECSFTLSIYSLRQEPEEEI